LGAGETVGFEELLDFKAEEIGDLLERDEDAVFQGKSRMGRRAPTHGATIVVMTTNVKRKESAAGDGSLLAGGSGETGGPFNTRG
jgi:hypothetical protein